ncbi:hypothetical protein [Candidatus Nanopusillus massiliensis]|uniref:hypothetical protein n=1 Tax=Candidatus Nanopusillus massiliensis TaxID=2897163 RepID=UPI001E5A5628|nr:hypothetical protein [Candidatus Nanopusillus massiliensis]
MMKYYNYIPLEVMYGHKVIANSTNNIACQILSNVNSSLMSENPQDSNNVYNKLLVNSLEINNSSGKPYLLSSTKNNPSPNQVTIIPGNLTLPEWYNNRIYI